MARFKSTKTHAWVITILLAVFMVINFMDKAILGIVAAPLMADLGLSPGEFGMIASSFFLLFSLSAIGFGFVAERVSSKKLLMLCAGIWGVAQFPLAFVASVPLLYFSRILLGMGEGPAYPLALHSCYKWFPNDKRNLPSAVIFQGVTAGLLISGPLLTFVVVKWNWHAAFMVLGVASLVWMALWAYFGAEGKVSEQGSVQDDADAPRLPYWLLITDRTFLANMLMYWTSYWIFSVMFTWVPSYMGKVMHYAPTDAGWMFMVFTAFNIPIVLGGSWVSQRLLKSGLASKYARGWLTSLLVLIGGGLILFAVFAVQNPLLKVILLAIGCNLPQITFVLSSAIVAEIMPAAQRSSMMSINSALATTGGLLAPALMGAFIQAAATPALGYDKGFVVAGVLCIVTSVIGLLLINPEASKRRFARLIETRRPGSAGASRSLLAK
ncbi:MFS transporter [Pseudomonas juntendi]|uniref:MFS transporter n=1 Tax=Pseudomonas juntendi TaxID=2666183 RepID=UPI001F248E17|nr:MFS transporter [Pseudomonas juntendi]MCO7054881.1 MFS transporter [Pseudomonas juntendi]UJM14751.1 MFS transporter [Pseudomonas juntendi]